ncbi:hypothetical protein E2562_012753 [Oryza meyeriana var. granulata]|uniref:Uncharacterized protein n=1 Tax=Oryza meyeriana var. granulata TaxID=110450 RepID=A0A6G1DH76_9ORYZ|nr:hypothetical protein E2562_012753 [Oryza meyeriana var. granulata]
MACVGVSARWDRWEEKPGTTRLRRNRASSEDGDDNGATGETHAARASLNWARGKKASIAWLKATRRGQRRAWEVLSSRAMMATAQGEGRQPVGFAVPR